MSNSFSRIIRESIACRKISIEQSETRPWTSERYERLEKERREVMSQDQLPERTAWRDRRLMASMRHKMQAAEEIGE